MDDGWLAWLSQYMHGKYGCIIDFADNPTTVSLGCKYNSRLKKKCNSCTMISCPLSIGHLIQHLRVPDSECKRMKLLHIAKSYL